MNSFSKLQHNCFASVHVTGKTALSVSYNPFFFSRNTSFLLQFSKTPKLPIPGAHIKWP